jgi:hypothetical protein
LPQHLCNFRVESLSFRVQGLGFRVMDLKLGLGFRVHDLKLRIRHWGFGIQGSEFGFDF